MSKLVAFGIVLGACVVGVASPASAQPAGDAPVSGQGLPWTVGGTLHVWGEEIALAPAKVVRSVNGELTFTEDATHTPTGLSLVYNGGPYPIGRAAYQISRLGVPTQYWILIELSIFSSLRADAKCEVFDGEPGHPGYGKVTWDSPFQCATTQYAMDWDYNFFIEPAGVKAKSSGRLSPIDGLSLTEGMYRTDGPYHRHGEADVGPGQWTTFFTVLQDTDTPFYENQARTEFSYRIVDNERPTGFWVGGLATNHHGKIKFSSDGRCAIYDHNPLERDGRLDDHSPIDSSYKCKAYGQFAHDPGEDDNRHFDATFFVAKH